MTTWPAKVALAAIVASAGLFPTSPGYAAAASSSWYQSGSDQGRTNYTPEEMLSATNAAKLKLAWTFPYTADDGEFAQPYQVISAGGRAYITDGAVYQVDAGTGAKLNTYSSVGCIDSNPALDAGMLIIPGAQDCSGGDFDGNVAAYRLANPNSPGWSTQGALGYAQVLGSQSGVVYTAYHETNGNYIDEISAANARTGQQVWQDNTHISNPTMMAADSTNLYLEINGSGFEAFSPKTGKQNWGGKTVAASKVQAVSGHVLATTGSLITSYSTSGVKQWSVPTNGTGASAATSSELVTISRTGDLGGFSLASGKALWHTASPVVAQQIIIAGSVVFTLSEKLDSSSGTDTVKLQAFKYGSGSKLWSNSFQSSDGGAAISVADGTVFLSLSGVGVYAYRVG